jgi:glycerate 2-kinase
VRVLIAPDSFSGSLSARQAAEAISAGWAIAAPNDQLSLLPLSDGGPGFADVFAGLEGARSQLVTVQGPLGDLVPADIVVIGQHAYIESAQACGRHLLAATSSETLLNATTFGVGQLLAAARAIDGIREITIGLGGSATNDGGAGLMQALGGLEAARELLNGVALTIATDVDNPMLGPQGSTAVYGPQKGAKPQDIPVLESRLEALAHEWNGQGVVHRPGSGAAGGLGFALLMLGANRVPGIDLIANATSLREKIAKADLVVTGEGSFDWQSLRGKVVSGVAVLASRVGVPVVVIAGQVLCGRREYSALGIESAYALAETPKEVEATMADAGRVLQERSTRVARSWSRR